MRQISKERYIVTFFITLGIFLLGLFLGMVIEGKRVEYARSEGEKQNLDFISLQIQYSYIDQLSKDEDCEGLQSTFDSSVTKLESTRKRLESFDEHSQINKDEFALLKRDYILAQLRYWLLAKRTKELCNSEFVTILYFFSDERQCSACDQQSFILTYLKKVFKEKLLIFTLDSRLEEEPMVALLKKAYDIESYPTVIIEDEAFSGFIENDVLIKKICSYYSPDTEGCEDIDEES